MNNIDNSNDKIYSEQFEYLYNIQKHQFVKFRV
jgi:hypothetical protein